MYRTACLIGILLVAIILLTGFVDVPVEATPAIANFNAKLQPGIWHGWGMGLSAKTPGAYLVDVSPINASKSGAFVARALVQPEYNGYQWNDVLRIMLPEGFKPLKVNVMVYRTADLPVVSEIEETLLPGVWHGWSLGLCEQNQGYLVEVTPLEVSVDGAYIERAVVQPEFDGTQWNDVVRVMIPEWMPTLKVQIRVYAVSGLPVIAEFTTLLQPGEWQGHHVGRSKVRQGYVVETTPLYADAKNGAHVQRAIVQPEYNGKKWNDILRLMIPEVDPAVEVHVRVYAWK